MAKEETKKKTTTKKTTTTKKAAPKKPAAKKTTTKITTKKAPVKKATTTKKTVAKKAPVLVQEKNQYGKMTKISPGHLSIFIYHFGLGTTQVSHRGAIHPQSVICVAGFPHTAQVFLLISVYFLIIL